MNKNGDLSVCLKCKMPIEYIDPQDDKPGVWRHNHMSLETPHEAIPPLMLDDNRILAHDAEKDVYLLKVPLEQLQCIRAALIEMAIRKRPTTDWQLAQELFEKATKELHVLLGTESLEEEKK